MASVPNTETLPEDVSKQPTNASDATDRPNGAKRWSSVLEHKNVQAGTKFFSAYAKTWVGITPLWLMGEAVTGRKVGSQFKKGGRQLVVAAEELRAGITSSTKDVVIIVDKHLQEGKAETTKTTEILKAAGTNAILVVSTSLAQAQDQIARSSPELKAAILSHSKDVVIIIDKGLKNPVVITGVHKFAKSKGIPYSQAMMQVASLAVSKLLVVIEEEETKAKATSEAIKEAGTTGDRKGKGRADGGACIEEIDVEELARTSSREAMDEAQRVGTAAGKVEEPKVVNEGDVTNDAQGKGKVKSHRDSCIIM